MQPTVNLHNKEIGQCICVTSQRETAPQHTRRHEANQQSLDDISCDDTLLNMISPSNPELFRLSLFLLKFLFSRADLTHFLTQTHRFYTPQHMTASLHFSRSVCRAAPSVVQEWILHSAQWTCQSRCKQTFQMPWFTHRSLVWALRGFTLFSSPDTETNKSKVTSQFNVTYGLWLNK